MHKDALTNDLVDRISKGDESSFRQFYELYHQQLFLFAKNFVDTQRAEDATADAFLMLWQNKERFTSSDNVPSFLYRTIRNTCLNILHREKMMEENHAQIAYLQQKEEPEIPLSQIESNLYKQILKELEMLPPQCAQIFKMSVLEKMQVWEIAEVLNLHQQTVKNQRYIALKKLRLAFSKNSLLVLFISLLEKMDKGHF